MKYIISIFILASLISCVNSKYSDNKVDLNSDSLLFHEFLNEIPDTTLPLTIVCGFESTFQKIDRGKFKRYIPYDFEVVAKVNQNNGQFYFVFYAKVGDLLYPYLLTYDNSGNRIDSVYLQSSNCADDSYEEYSTWTLLGNDLTLKMTDTAKFYSFNDDYSIRFLDSVIVNVTTGEINTSGLYKVIDTEKKIIEK